MLENISKVHSISLREKKSLEITGVHGILSLDDGEIVVELEEESLIIEGEEIKVEDLSKKEGKILLSGNISGLFYTKKHLQKSKKGLFK